MRTMVTDLAYDLEAYANSLSGGYLKTHKAISIVDTLTTIRGIKDDEVRFLKFLKSGLEMEGFKPVDIELIMGWLYERI